jgi:hypothetical protein
MDIWLSSSVLTLPNTSDNVQSDPRVGGIGKEFVCQSNGIQGSRVVRMISVLRLFLVARRVGVKFPCGFVISHQLMHCYGIRRGTPAV